jgi:hypothetical protein
MLPLLDAFTSQCQSESNEKINDGYNHHARCVWSVEPAAAGGAASIVGQNAEPHILYRTGTCTVQYNVQYTIQQQQHGTYARRRRVLYAVRVYALRTVQYSTYVAT